jgi:hypothetical protein
MHVCMYIIGNIFFIDVKYRGSLHIFKINITILHMFKIKIATWILLKVLFLVSLDTLYLNSFLHYIHKSNGSTSYMVGNIILINFQWYVEFHLTP